VSTPVHIINLKTGETEEAQLLEEITIAHFIETQQKWRPIVEEVTRIRHRAGETDTLPRHWHWDWTRKANQLGLLGIQFYGIECRGRLEGLMKVDLDPTIRCRIPEQMGKEVVYIDYIEAAPWNVKQIVDAPEYGAVGSRLFAAAVHLSVAEGFKGRVALHSLPTSEGFYVQACQMTAVERDVHKQNLLWCEYTPEQAQRFLSGE